jgi:hypothetical protein
MMPLLLLLITLALPGQLWGQLVRGRVVDGAGAPLGHALVQVRGDSITFSAQVVTTASGNFAIAVPEPGRYTVRLAAIGFEPRAIPAFDTPIGGRRLEDLVMTRAVLTLQDIEVVASFTRCGSGGGGGEVLGRLLDAARTSLEVMSATLNQRGSGFRVSAISRRAVATRADSLIVADTATGTIVAWPIQSIDPDSIARVGFAVLQPLRPDAGREWYGPDLRVLFSEWFLASHCFLVDGAASTDELIALTFAPSARRDGIVDVEGVLWIERGSLALRRMTFVHRDLPRGLPAGSAGGEMHFAILPSGAWMPVEWRLFAPIEDGDDRARGVAERIGRLVAIPER